MEGMQKARNRKDEDFRALRKGMAYCWSVAVTSCPEQGVPRFERWLESVDPDLRWILRENLKKKRLARLDEQRVKRCQATLGG